MVFIIQAPVYYKHIIDSILNFFYLYRPLCASLCLSWPSMANADRGSPDSSRVFRSTHDSHKGMTPPPPPQQSKLQKFQGCALFLCHVVKSVPCIPIRSCVRCVQSLVDVDLRLDYLGFAMFRPAVQCSHHSALPLCFHVVDL